MQLEAKWIYTLAVNQKAIWVFFLSFFFKLKPLKKKYSHQVSFETFQIVMQEKECKNASPK